MAKRLDFSEAAIDKAVARARKGKPRQLAMLIKAASLDDLVGAMEFEARYPFPDLFGTRDGFYHLRALLKHVGIRREVRDDMNRRLREAGNKAVREWKAKQKAGEVANVNE